MKDDDLRILDHDETKEKDVMHTPKTAILVGAILIIIIIATTVIYLTDVFK